MPQLEAGVDHVAVAVPDLDVAHRRWGDELGGRPPPGEHHHGRFRARRLRYRNDAVLEILSPRDDGPGADPIRRFLDDEGSAVHHLTLTVPDLPEAVALLRGTGLDVVDHADLDETWHGVFLRPSQMGGILVQITRPELVTTPAGGGEAGEPGDDRDEPPLPPSDGATLQGPLLRHPDLDHTRRLWRLLGARITPDAGGLVCRWSRSPLTVRVVPGSTAATMGLRFSGARPLPPDDSLGPAVIPTVE